MSNDAPLSIPTITANDGLEIPQLGLGTYNLRGAPGVESIVAGIEAGYRLLDSAFNYENEGALGQAVRRASVPREELVLTSKLPGRHHDYNEAIETVHESLYRAGLEYWDLYLIHWPLPRLDKYVQAFQALADLQEQGLIRSIGVCNFLPEHLERLEKEVGIIPSVNQIELHPFFNQADMRAYHAEKGIITESWSPLGRKLSLVDHPELVEMAKRYGKSTAQLILRWHIELGAVPIPKSASPARQVENAQVFDWTLDADDIAFINSLTRPDGRMTNQDPAVHEEF